PPDWGRNFEFSSNMGGEDGAFSDFFSSLFGQRGFARGGGARGGGFAMAGEDHVATIEIDLEDAYKGGSRTLELSGGRGGAPRTLKVNIPAGVTAGKRIRLAGQGSPGVGGGPAGDLYLEVQLRP